MDQQSPETISLSELRALGLTIDIEESVAARIRAKLLIIEGQVLQGAFRTTDGWSSGKRFSAVYHVIAQEIVDANTPDEVIESMIPHVVLAFSRKKNWRPYAADLDGLNPWLRGPIQEWKGKRLLLAAGPRIREQPQESEAGTTIEDEIERRQRLLASYKSATGNPSNRRIYEAANSGIHKPEFYHWQKGSLSSESATCINFERFLRDKKPAIPRKPHH